MTGLQSLSLRNMVLQDSLSAMAQACTGLTQLELVTMELMRWQAQQQSGQGRGGGGGGRGRIRRWCSSLAAAGPHWLCVL